ncbi:RRF1 [Candida pseudojiufengensis]|uniref:RRF1 n=1 Tax=Candida pseudojiufengensis TaxID=497109 RepID=UPI002223F2F7|nr:RRF1 [Candida pseudojiufengensis]KAI5962142.1 RRF1 [Candida pseudojiufengensis]
MFRLSIQKFILKSNPIRSNYILKPRFFNTSPILLKKKSTKQKLQKQDEKIQAEAAEEIITPTIDFPTVESKFEKILTKFEKQANEIKLGKLNPKIFDNLIVNIGNQKDVEEVQFNTIAQTSIKGRNFIVTMFDPSNGQSLINAIIGSGLNMSGTIDPSNKFNIKIPLPPITSETKQQNLKQLKELFDKLKNNKTNSLTSIRGDTRSKFQSNLKNHKITDLENKQLTQLEKLHKLYIDKLHEKFKAYEKQILK